MRLFAERRKLHIPSIVDRRKRSEVADLVDLLAEGQRHSWRREGTHVVRRREDGDAKPVVLDRVPALSDLMTANNSRDLVDLRPSPRHVRPEANPNSLRSPTSSALSHTARMTKTHPLARPSSRHILRIRPQHLAHEPIVPRLLLPDPIDLFDIREQDVLATEEASVDDKVSLDAAEEGGVLGVGSGVGAGRFAGGDEGCERDWEVRR